MRSKKPSRPLIARRWSQILTKLYNHDASKIDKNLQCFTCGRTGVLDRAHITPKHKGGSDDLSNLHLLCKSCHAESDLLTGKLYWRWFRFQVKTAFARRIQLSIALGEVDCEHTHHEVKRMSKRRKTREHVTNIQNSIHHAARKLSENAKAYTEKMRPHFVEAISMGYKTDRAIAEYLNNKNIPSPRYSKWSRGTVHRTRKRLCL